MADDDISFLNLVLMLGTFATSRIESISSAPADKRADVIPRAREVINMLAALRKRTVSSLSDEEDRVLVTLLKDLQARYVKALGFKSSAQPDDTGEK